MLPAGYKWFDHFKNLGRDAYFHTATEKTAYMTWLRNLGYTNEGVLRLAAHKLNAYACRCLKKKEGWVK